MSEWSDEELEAAVRGYMRMLASQQQGAAYSKTAERKRLRNGSLSARSEASIEYRMRNISAVLDANGRPILSGYLPARNVGDRPAKRIWTLVKKVEAAASEPAALSPPASRPGKRRAPPPMIFFNIGWMKNYTGTDASDPTIGGHGYLDNHDHGAEAFNFLPTKDRTFRGYRPPGAGQKTDISRLGAGTKDEFIDGVLVVWIAREKGSGETLIVGWYDNARVYRSAQPGGVFLYGNREDYSAEARIEDSKLLPEVARSFRIASSRTKPGEGFGQKPTWYGSDAVNKRVWQYISSFQSSAPPRPKPKGKKPPRNLDPELRCKVEQSAVEHARAYYKAKYGEDCYIKSVEKDAAGWDLEVYCAEPPLLVEVKGLMNSDLVCELTPNEYKKMKDRANRKRYVVYVVNNALAVSPAVPIPSVFEHVSGDTWQTKDGRTLKITEKIAAVLTCT